MVAATAAIALSSCSKNDVVEVATPNDNPNTIGLSVGTFATKAGETTTSGLNTSGNVIKVYTGDQNFGTAGTATFTCSDDSWTISVDDTNGTWADVSFPLSLYSLNTGVNEDPFGDLPVDPTNGTAAAYTVKTATKDQEDLVYYGAELGAIPSNGEISATFKHALSRIMMQYKASAESNDKLYIASVKLVNVSGTETPTISDAATIGWSATGDTDATYAYYAATKAETAMSATTTAASFANPTASDMYIIPQTTLEFTATSSDYSYVEVVYRSTDDSGTNIVGYAEASDHPQYNSSTWEDADGTALAATDPLYVKVAFPVSKVTLVDGVYYNFVLDFDGSSVIVAEDGFVDDEGKGITTPDATPLPGEGEEINPDASTAIGLTVTVIEWPTAGTDTSL